MNNDWMGYVSFLAAVLVILDILLRWHGRSMKRAIKRLGQCVSCFCRKKEAEIRVGLFFGYIVAYLQNWLEREIITRLDIIELVLFCTVAALMLCLAVVRAMILLHAANKNGK